MYSYIATHTPLEVCLLLLFSALLMKNKNSIILLFYFIYVINYNPNVYSSQEVNTEGEGGTR